MTTEDPALLPPPPADRPETPGGARARRGRLLVDVRAVSLHPVARYLRAFGRTPGEVPEGALAWDASGQVVDVSDDASLYRVGDTVCFPAGVLAPGERPPARCWVDELHAGFKPDSLSHAEAAVLPLHALTADEAVFECLGLDRDGANAGQTLLVSGAASGLGALVVQLGRRAGLKVLAVLPSPTGERWVADLGAHHVFQPSTWWAGVQALAGSGVDHVALLGAPELGAGIVDVVGPGGALVQVEGAAADLPLDALRAKGVRVSSPFGSPRPGRLGTGSDEFCYVLNDFALEIDAGHVRSPLTSVLRPLDADHLQRACEALGACDSIGHIALAMD